MENSFLIGDTVKFDWRDCVMLGFILKKTVLYIPAITSVRDKQLESNFYMVEMNFNRTANDLTGDIKTGGIVNHMRSEQMTTCRFVLTEKAINIFDGRYS